RRLEPSDRVHTATAFPPASTATWGWKASWPAGDRVCGGVGGPEAERRRVWIRRLVASDGGETSRALAPASTATWGLSASWPAPDRVCTGLRVPEAERRRSWIRMLVPSDLSHTTTAFPPASTATWGSTAFWPAADRFCGGVVGTGSAPARVTRPRNEA